MLWHARLCAVRRTCTGRLNREVELGRKVGGLMRISSKLGAALTRCGDCTNATLCPLSKPFFSLESTDGTDVLRTKRCKHIQAK